MVISQLSAPLLLSPLSIWVGISGFLAGRLANRCWFVKPEKAQRDSWTLPHSLACFPLRAHFAPVWVYCRTESGGKSSDPIFCLRSICRGEASATGLCSHLTNRWLIQANYNTSTLKLADRDRSQIPHLWNRVCLMNNAIIISTVDHRLEIHSAEAHSRLYGSVQHFS